MNLSSYVNRIVRDLAIPGGRRSAHQTFMEFWMEHKDHIGDLVTELGKARHIPPEGTIYVGEAWVLFSNPARGDWMWRCGTHHPCVGVLYKSKRTALRAAQKHAGEIGATIQEVAA